MDDRPRNSHQIMENPATFDLNQAIQQWRQQLAASPVIRLDDVDELESHLRDAVAAMESKGLTSAEAFWIARHRLGTGDSLQGEFGKVNASQIWLDRTLWMIAGSIGIGTISSITHSLSNLATLGVYRLDFLGQLMGHAQALLYPIILSSVLLTVWRSRDQMCGILTRLGNWSRSHPILAAIAVVTLHVIQLAAARGISYLTITQVPTSQLAEVMGWQWGWAKSVLQLLIWPILLGWLLVKARRNTRTVTQP